MLPIVQAGCPRDTGGDELSILTTGSGTGDTDQPPDEEESGEGCSEQPDVCAELVACLAVALPDEDVGDLEPGGACWCGTPQQAADCMQLCVDQLELAGKQFPDIEACGGEGSTTTTGDGDGDGDVPEVVGASLAWSSTIGVIPDDLAFNPDDSLLASAGYDAFDGDFTIWSVAQGSPVWGPVATATENPAVTWSPSGDRVASGGLVGGFRVYTAQGQTAADLGECQALDITALAWHPSQNLILAGGSSAQFFSSPSVCIRDVATDSDLAHWKISDTSAIEGAVWSNSGARFATLTDCVITVFDTNSQSIINTINIDSTYCEFAQRLAWRPGTQEIAAIVRVNQDYTVAFAQATGSIPYYLDAEAMHLAYSPDGSKLALIGRTGTVWIVDADTLDLQHQFAAHSGLTMAIAWSHDGQRLATGGENPRVAVWDLAYGP